MPIVIRTNNHRREIIDGYQLTDTERAVFDYLPWPAIDAGEDSASFIRYQGDLIDLGTIERITHGDGDLDQLADWEGAQAWSMSNGIVFKYVEENMSTLAVVGYFYVTSGTEIEIEGND